MDIIVHGEGIKFYKPDQIEFNLNFYVNDKTYEKVLESGLKSVEKFIEEVLSPLNINKEELKTRSFNIAENIRYDYEAKKEIHNGFDYRQSATLKVDYDRELISNFMDKVAKLKDAPKYVLTFNIKNKEIARKEATQLAYSNAKEKAEIIASAAGKTLKDCVKIDFKPFEEKVISNSRLADNDFGMMYEETAIKGKTMRASSAEVISNTFTPEDVEIMENLYCLWLAE